MRCFADEAYLHARIYAMRSRLLSLKDYVSLARNQEAALSDTAPAAPDSRAAKQTVFREQIAPLMPLMYAVEKYTPVFLAFLRQFEAYNAKLILAKAFNLQSLEQWHDIGTYALLKQNLLEEAIGIEGLRPLLTGTYLADVFEDVSSYAQTELRVDMCAAKNLYAASSLFSRQAKRDFQDLTGRRIAVTTTVLCLRLQKTYQWDAEKIRLFLASFHDALNGKIWPQAKIVEEALNRHLEQLRANGAQEPSVAAIEHYLEQHYYTWISSMFHRDFNSVFCVVAYLWMLFYQIRNLFKIIEGRRFGFSPERILGSIVCNA